MTRPLAVGPRRCNIMVVERFRALAAFLSCLAVLAAGVMAVAAFVPAAAAVERTVGQPTAGAPCSHCDDCDTSVPCPMPVTVCVQASSTAAPTVADASFSPPGIASTRVDWLFRDTTLNGRSLPPDPFPPRA